MLLALAGLNGSLATLVFAARRTTAHALLAALLGGNALAAILWAASALAGREPVTALLAFSVNSLTLAPLAVLPLVVPRRRLTPARERGALAIAAVVSLAAPALELARLLGFEPPALVEHLVTAPWMLLVWLVPSVGTLVLLDAHLSARTRGERTETRFFLFAFLAKCAIVVGGFPLAFDATALYEGAPATPGAPGYALWSGAAFVAWAAPRVALLAAPVALLASQVSKRAGERRAAHDVALALPLALVAAVPLGLPAIELEFLLLRPLVLTYALVRVRFLGIEAKREAGALGVALVLSGACLFLVVGGLADERGFPPRAATAAALVAGVMVPSALAWPALARGLGWSVARQGRRDAYRAALEALAAEGRLAEAYDALAPLRRHLAIDDRAHEALAAAIGPAAPTAGLREGALLAGRYRVIREIGKGASGEVWLARDERLAREVAVKRLKGDARRDAAALARFEREARLAGAILHPNLVAVHDVEVVNGEAYLVMEHAAGGTLETRIRARGALDEREAVEAVVDVLAGLAALHERGVVHRDVKPSNVLFDAKGRAKLGDFTLAHEAVSHETLGVEPAHAGAGTLAFMAPEQARGGRITVATDLYAAAATLYAALAGRPPIAVDGLTESEARARVAREAPALPLAGVGERVNAVIARGLSKAPEERFANAAEMAAALAGAPFARV